MKKYISPEMEYKLFSKERVETASGANLQNWADDHTGGKIAEVSFDNLQEIPNNIKFTF